MSNPQKDSAASSRKLYRPRQGRVIGGVCAGIADYFGWDRTLVRVLTVASIFIPGPQVLAYIVFWILMPDERKAFAA
ncbi:MULTISPECIES: PspC domain-containing protein [Isoptericola]|uniref:PspC domain-containing protein n=1 Tax=Isoptericola sediminis TaxID=2733572 RepID=A0A849JV71_9MICO|nr:MULTISPECIES: PspC domain-containing protein [Isoptericola]MDO8143683.1 PspC domain-containing protein [Isoptericola sp. 178]MDO8147580.1 PspC domain-containing protein [Isoptericola sp. b515]MDO8150118.1 PspC domain-containing protein [Isoptericola sp. b408]NNU27256.1 PspC domain-containing protein [Isoptericola sediminis]